MQGNLGPHWISHRSCQVRCWLQADMGRPEIDVCLYEALAVKVVLICVAWLSLSLDTPLFPGRVLR